MSKTQVTDTGQIKLPENIINYLNVKPGDILDFTIDADGRVFINRLPSSVQELKGILHRPGMQPVSIETMNDVIKQRQVNRICKD
ncbi:Transcriptional regulator, AbrB family protein [Planktothrix serta PCC 8927]|uniref:Transcriptional regulator, AbrB family protein n=1 Tax=Planktothrix serta PCC 8927 TaxID=671068 RepID=A0A7Z9BNM2_9CYAN|nr:hypothetical protein [Planktothrix serta]VXD13352.1 Transcriptional regulator, AbrB family protein [Planktothrix serta PCC 8927]